MMFEQFSRIVHRRLLELVQEVAENGKLTPSAVEEFPAIVSALWLEEVLLGKVQADHPGRDGLSALALPEEVPPLQEAL